jgi:hypothetical protein
MSASITSPLIRITLRFDIMTVPVDQLHIVIRLFPTEFSGNDMIDLHQIVPPKKYTAPLASTSLSFEECRHSLFDAGHPA